MKLILTYLIFQGIYVILNTIKSILTIKSTKWVAATASAITYAVYTFVLIYTVADFSIYVKAGLTAATNFIGTVISMWILEKIRKDKLWQITATIRTDKLNEVRQKLNKAEISYNCANTNTPAEYVFNCFCKTKNESKLLKDILTAYNAKYIVHEETVKL